jgi:predicted RNA-binding protein Jag
MRETKEAIMQVLNGAAYVDLAPQASHIRRRQHEAIRAARLESASYGEEPLRRVRILRH